MCFGENGSVGLGGEVTVEGAVPSSSIKYPYPYPYQLAVGVVVVVVVVVAVAVAPRTRYNQSGT